jgi:hypothetical protein
MDMLQVDYGSLLQERGLDTYARELTKRRDALLTSLTSNSQVALHCTEMDIHYDIFIYMSILMHISIELTRRRDALLSSLSSNSQVACNYIHICI